MKIVYVVEHSYLLDGQEETKIIGVFSTKPEAHRAIRMLRTKSGFRRHPKNFIVDPYLIDQVGWESGFKTIRYKSGKKRSRKTRK